MPLPACILASFWCVGTVVRQCLERLGCPPLVCRVCCFLRRPNDVISSAEKRLAIHLAENTLRAAVEPGGNAGKIRVHASLATSPVFSPTCINPAALAWGMLLPAYARLWQVAEQRRCLKAKVKELAALQTAATASETKQLELDQKLRGKDEELGRLRAELQVPPH